MVLVDIEMRNSKSSTSVLYESLVDPTAKLAQHAEPDFHISIPKVIAEPSS